MKFTDFSKMMEALDGINAQEGISLAKKHLSPEDAAKFETDGTLFFLYASNPAEALLKEFIEKSGLNVITQTLENDDKDETISFYYTGEHHVNRERWFFCRSNKQATCREK